ncbi:MAG: proteasome assembly chaperone family protein [Halobacteriaceae archaeon]
MEDIDVDWADGWPDAAADLRDPVLVEGLPGVGNVGKLAVEQLIEERDDEVACRIYAPQFPPQVSVGDDGETELAHAAVHAVDAGDRDLLVLTGEHQPGDPPGQYRVTDAILDVVETCEAAPVFALGGVPTGELVEEYDVLGAVTDADGPLAADLDEAGVALAADQPEGGIVGVSGLLMGLGERRGLPAACLMGETSGYLVDPKSAQAVLVVLEDVLGVTVDFESLEDRAEEVEEVMSKIQEMEDSAGGVPADDDLRYIG